MQKRYRKKDDLDPNIMAFNTVQESTKEPTKAQISEFMAIMGRKGGLKAGIRKIAPEIRQENARTAALARWKKIKN